jgi:hypothetical protein
VGAGGKGEDVERKETPMGGSHYPTRGGIRRERRLVGCPVRSACWASCVGGSPRKGKEGRWPMIETKALQIVEYRFKLEFEFEFNSNSNFTQLNSK